MLGRHGNNVFWMSRYLERSENNARRIQAALHHAMSNMDQGRDEWMSIATAGGHDKDLTAKHNKLTMANAVDFLLRDRENPDSVITLMSNARQNGRAVRTGLSREAWQSLNESWIDLESALKRPVKIHDLPEILQSIIKNSEGFRGTVFGTMLRNDTFNFLRIGTFVERSDNTARIIDSKYHRLLPTAKIIGGGDNQAHWEIMLRSLAAWRSFNWLNLDPAGVADFLIFDARMPRSLHLCYKEIVLNLSAISEAYGRDFPSLRLAKKICSTFEGKNAKSVHDIDLKEFITDHIVSNNELSIAIGRDFNFD